MQCRRSGSPAGCPHTARPPRPAAAPTQVCERAGVSPPPIPMHRLDAATLAAGLAAMREPQMAAAARRMATRMAGERGLEVAVASIYR